MKTNNLSAALLSVFCLVFSLSAQPPSPVHFTATIGYEGYNGSFAGGGG